MGHYTTLARLGKLAKRTVGDAPRYVAKRQTSADRTQSPPAAAFLCPSCGDGAEIRASCARCDVEMYPRGRAVRVGELPSEIEAPSRSMASVAWLLGVLLVLPAGVLAFLFWIGERARLFTKYEIEARILVGLLSVAAVSWLGVLAKRQSGRGWRGLRRAFRRARAALRRWRLAPNDPEVAEGAVRLVGRVRVEGGEAHVESPVGRVRVPLDAELALRDGDREAGFLEDGGEVELVGHLAPSARPRGAYRSAEDERTLDARRPVDLWRRR